MKINENGFIPRPKHHDTFYSILVIALITVVILFLTGVLKFHKEQTAKVITVKVDTVVIEDSLPRIYNLVRPLRSREAFSDTIYILGEQKLIGFGHAKLPEDTFSTITYPDAVKQLKIDIYKSYQEWLRLNENRIIIEVYSIFISGRVLDDIPKVFIRNDTMWIYQNCNFIPIALIP